MQEDSKLQGLERDCMLRTGASPAYAGNIIRLFATDLVVGSVSRGAESVLRELMADDIDACDSFVRMKYLSEVFSLVVKDQALRDRVLEQIDERCITESLGCKIKPALVGVKYDYLGTNDPKIAELYKEREVLDSLIKAREAHLRSIPDEGEAYLHKVEELGRTLYIPRYFVGDDVPFSVYLEEVYGVRDCAPSFNITMRIVHSAKVSFGLSHVFIEVGDKMFRIDLREDDMFVTDDGFVGAEVVGGHILTILREVDSYSQDVRIAVVGPCVFHRVLVSVEVVESMRQLVRIHKLLS